MITSAAEPLAEEKCQEFLERVAEAVAAVLQVRGEISDDDVSIAVQIALRGLIQNSAQWKEWRRNSLAMHQKGQEFDTPHTGLRRLRMLLLRLVRGIFPYLKSVGNNFHRSHRRFAQTHAVGDCPDTQSLMGGGV